MTAPRADSSSGMTTRRPGIADRATPLVYDHWYIAAFAHEVGRTMFGRKILGDNILFFRKQDGTVAALQERCPHRSFPLSQGRLNGDEVTCGYHGITYDAGGACVNVPSQACSDKKIPSSLVLRNYPVVERGPFVWIWMGAANRADEGLIPGHPWLADPACVHTDGYFYVKSSYIPLHENVIDLTHAHYLHGDSVATEGFGQTDPEVVNDGKTIRVRRVEKNTLAPVHYGKSAGIPDHRVNRISDAKWLSPAFMYALAQIEDLEPAPGARTEFNFWIAHAFTPASQDETHYFWSNARDSSTGDAQMTESIRQRSTAVYQEDVDALQWAQRLWAEARPDMKEEVSVAADLPGIQMRRIIAQLAAMEGETQAA